MMMTMMTMMMMMMMWLGSSSWNEANDEVSK